ncbi:cyclic nucleotide-binding domain-containing protein [Bacteriovoracaceae bacterium]|nr:cyclic nucleotide-binding domain-containing protein [Bacteriovoracaceae bacterium]
MSEIKTIQLPKHTLVCKQGNSSKHLYLIVTGEVLICIMKNSAVTPISYLGPGEFIGEFSFLDNQDRSANVITTRESQLIKINQTIIKKKFPSWLFIIAKRLSANLRNLDNVINLKGLKKKSDSSLVPLTIDEQRFFYQLIQNDT